jgi:hypothetical protein
MKSIYVHGLTLTKDMSQEEVEKHLKEQGVAYTVNHISGITLTKSGVRLNKAGLNWWAVEIS